MMQCAEEEVSDAPPTAIEPNTGASHLQASEQPVVQNCSSVFSRFLLNFKRKREKTQWELKSNVTVTDAHCEKENSLKCATLSSQICREEGGCYKCPSGTNIHLAK